MYITLDIHGVVSEPRYYKKATTPNVFTGSWTAAIEMVKGNITGIVWDDSCDECSDDICIDGKNCGIEYSEVDDCNEGRCDFKVSEPTLSTTQKD